MRITLRQLEIFSAVARTGSTAAAGEEVSLSQSAVSAAVNDLELTLGLLLFDRIGKRLVLNTHGRALHERARNLLDCVRGIEDDFSVKNARGDLKIAASTTVGNYLIPSLLRSYLENYPETRVEVLIGNTKEVVLAVRDFKADAGIVEGPSHIAGLNFEHWRDDELVLVAAPNHYLVQQYSLSGKPVPIEHLKSASWILREEGSGTRDSVQAALFPHLGELKSTIVLGSSEAIKRAVGEGLGISCLSRLLVKDMLFQETLSELITELPVIIRPLYVVLHSARTVTPAMSKFLFQK